MKTIKGDLIQLALEGEFDVIIHGCNCFCAMGAGIAKTIKEVFPEAYIVDNRTGTGNASKLGNFTYATILKNENKIIVVNAYTQYDYTIGKEPNVDYKAIRKVMRDIKHAFHGSRIGYPKIGAGLAGGNWDKIAKIIDEELEGENHTLVVWDKE